MTHLATLTDTELGIELAKAKREYEEAAALFEDARVWQERRRWRKEKRSAGQRLGRLRDEVKRRRWQRYEAEKTQLVGLSGAEYEAAICCITDELGV